MAGNKNAAAPDPADPMIPIEEHRQALNLEPWVYAGLLAAYGWGAGKEMTRAEFIRARDAWLHGPMAREVQQWR